MVMTPPLVWANGQPIDFSALRRDEAGPALMSTRSILTGHPSQGLTPSRLAQLLLEAEQGDMIAYLELAEDIEEKEWQYVSVLGTRKRAVAQLPIEVIAADDSPDAKADADFIRAWLERDTLEQEIFDIVDAIGKGFSVVEIVWQCSANAWLPERLEHRDPRWFRFDPVDGRTLRLWTEHGFEDLKPFKYIQHVHAAKTGLPVRGGLARPASWAWMFKNFSMKEWLSFIETYGMPMRVGKYDNGETEENIRKLMRAIAQMGSDAAAVFPKSMDVEFIDGKQRGAGGQGEFFKLLVDYVDAQLSKLVLGQTATTDAVAGGLGAGQANVHNDVRADIERADARQLAATLNRDLVRPMILLNRGQRDRFPRLRIGRPDPVDIEGLTKALERVVPLGLRVGEQTVRQRLGLPDPKPDEPVLIGPGAGAPPAAAPGLDGSMPHGAAPPAFLGLLKPSYGGDRAASADRVETRRAARAETGPPVDAIDATTDEALDDWLPLISPVVQAVRDAADQATSLEQLRDRLIGTLEAMDPEQFAELLARGSFAARIEAMATPPGGA